MFQKTPNGDGVSLHAVLRRVRRPDPRGHRGPRRRHRRALARARHGCSSSQAGIVSPKWKKQSYKGIVTDSVVVFVVRAGEPEAHQVAGTTSCARASQVVTPNPFTSGGARWNIMAAYGSWRKQGKTDAQAQANLLKLFKNVVVQDKSARDSRQHLPLREGRRAPRVRERGLLRAQKQGQNLPFVIPKTTILIENPIAVTKSTGDAAKANQFLRFLRTPAAQQVFADYGLPAGRPEGARTANRKKFPVRPGPVHDRPARPRRLGQGAEALLRPEERRHGAIERKVGGVTGYASPSAAPPRAGSEGQGCNGPVPRRRD